MFAFVSDDPLAKHWPGGDMSEGKPRELRTDIWDGKAWVPHVIRDYPEYARRNLLVASSIGATAEARVIRERLLQMKRPPKWLLKSCDAIETRAAKLTPDLAKWRDLVGYEPALAQKE